MLPPPQCEPLTADAVQGSPERADLQVDNRHITPSILSATWPFGPVLLKLFSKHGVYIDGSPYNPPPLSNSSHQPPGPASKPLPLIFEPPSPPALPSEADSEDSATDSALPFLASSASSGGFSESTAPSSDGPLSEGCSMSDDLLSSHDLADSDAPIRGRRRSLDGASDASGALKRFKRETDSPPQFLPDVPATCARSAVPLSLPDAFALTRDIVFESSLPPLIDPRSRSTRRQITVDPCPEPLKPSLDFAVPVHCGDESDRVLISWLCRFWMRDGGATLHSSVFLEALAKHAPEDLGNLLRWCAVAGRDIHLPSFLEKARADGLVYLWKRADGSADIELAKEYSPLGLQFRPLIDVLRRNAVRGFVPTSQQYLLNQIKLTKVPLPLLAKGFDTPSSYIDEAVKRGLLVETVMPGSGKKGYVLDLQWWDPCTPFSSFSIKGVEQAAGRAGYEANLSPTVDWDDPRVLRLVSEWTEKEAESVATLSHDAPILSALSSNTPVSSAHLDGGPASSTFSPPTSTPPSPPKCRDLSADAEKRFSILIDIMLRSIAEGNSSPSWNHLANLLNPDQRIWVKKCFRQFGGMMRAAAEAGAVAVWTEQASVKRASLNPALCSRSGPKQGEGEL